MLPLRCTMVTMVTMLCLLSMCGGVASAAADTLQVGSKRFTESYILGEILTQTAAQSGPAQHQQGLGNTAIVFGALKAGSIDVYPEYLGTIDRDILQHRVPATLEQMRAELAPLGIGIAVKLGFNNSYALATRADLPDSPQRLSDLAHRAALRIGLSHEFLGRSDGWPGLAARYALPQHPVGLDHGIAYAALAAGQIDVIDIYSTDAKIAKLGLHVLADDQHYFPSYDAVLLYRLDLPQRFPSAWRALRGLEGRIDNAHMIAMNGAVELDGRSFANVARDFVTPRDTTASARDGFSDKLFGADFGRLTRTHVLLVLAAVLAASIVGIPLGVMAAFAPRLRRVVLGLVGVLQTVPSLALLAMLIPLLGRIGTAPALLALSLYALLPIVRNTCIGVQQVPQGLRMAALALGLTARQRLRYIDLPLALPVIMAGLQTAAVMTVGTATIAAFIGAGGYGERIAIGLALNDHQMLLAGAIPAAALAVLTQWLFDLLEWRLRRGSVR